MILFNPWPVLMFFRLQFAACKNEISTAETESKQAQMKYVCINKVFVCLGVHLFVYEHGKDKNKQNITTMSVSNRDKERYQKSLYSLCATIWGTRKYLLYLFLTSLIFFFQTQALPSWAEKETVWVESHRKGIQKRQRQLRRYWEKQSQARG